MISGIKTLLQESYNSKVFFPPFSLSFQHTCCVDTSFIGLPTLPWLDDRYKKRIYVWRFLLHLLWSHVSFIIKRRGHRGYNTRIKHMATDWELQLSVHGAHDYPTAPSAFQAHKCGAEMSPFSHLCLWPKAHVQMRELDKIVKGKSNFLQK